MSNKGYFKRAKDEICDVAAPGAATLFAVGVAAYSLYSGHPAIAVVPIAAAVLGALFTTDAAYSLWEKMRKDRPARAKSSVAPHP